MAGRDPNAPTLTFHVRWPLGGSLAQGQVAGAPSLALPLTSWVSLGNLRTPSGRVSESPTNILPKMGIPALTPTSLFSRAIC